MKNLFREMLREATALFLTLLALTFIALVASQCLACGGAGVARVGASATVAEACEQAEQEIEDRNPAVWTLAEVESDLSAIRIACDRVQLAIRGRQAPSE